MMRTALILTSLCFATAAHSEERQLWRIVDIQNPLKGYLLGPETGATEDANFESCAGTRVLVEQSKLERERGTCEGDDKGTFAIYSGPVEGIAVYGMDQQKIGTIEAASRDTKGAIEMISVKSDLEVLKLSASDLDWQKIDNSDKIQVLYVGAALDKMLEKMPEQ